jgi:hypothetical protein
MCGVKDLQLASHSHLCDRAGFDLFFAIEARPSEKWKTGDQEIDEGSYHG